MDRIVAGCLDNDKRRVVIPGFGALIRRPDGEIVFVDILNADDGVMSAALEREAGLTRDEAQKAIAGYSFHLKTELLHRKKAGIEGVGLICMTPDGSCELEPFAVEVPPATVNSDSESAESSLPANQGDEVYDTGPVSVHGVADDPKPAIENERDHLEKNDPEVADIKEKDHSAGPDAHMAEVVVAEEVVTCVVPDISGTAESDIGESEPRDAASEAAAPAVTPSAGDIGPDAENDFTIAARRSERDIIRRLLYDEDPLPAPPEKGRDLPGTEKLPEGNMTGTAVEGAGRRNMTEGNDEMRLLAEKRREERQAAAGRRSAPQVQLRKPKKKRVDGVLIIGIIAIVIGLAIFVYGELVKKELDLDRQEFVMPE